MNNEQILLGNRFFSIEDQEEFSEFSGDKNPIHLDIRNERRTITGKCIVHGIHAFLWSIELFTRKNLYIPCSYVINFRNKIILNQRVYCFWDKNNEKLLIKNSDNKNLLVIKYREILQIVEFKNGLELDNKKKLDKPKEPNEKFLNSKVSIESKYGGEPKYAKKLFPHLSKYGGETLTYEVSILSNIVGMQIPGLNSLFTSCKIFFRSKQTLKSSFRVQNFNARSKLINLRYEGKNLNAEIAAYLLQKSAPSKITKKIIKSLIKFNRFDGRKALIIGGSRGIGSFVAKVIGLLGAEVTISYKVGNIEASNVCNEINNHAIESNSRAVKFDVLSDNYEDVFKNVYDDLFYFATPKIFSENSALFSEEKYNKFKEIYCDAFKSIALEFISKGGKQIFYPSCIAVEQEIKGLEEYKLAKLDGENICEELNSNYFVNVIVQRLNRVNTDQTLTIYPVKSLDPYEVAKDIACKMSSN